MELKLSYSVASALHEYYSSRYLLTEHHVVTVQRFAMSLAIMLMPLGMHHPTMHCCTSSEPHHGSRTTRWQCPPHQDNVLCHTPKKQLRNVPFSLCQLGLQSPLIPIWLSTFGNKSDPSRQNLATHSAQRINCQLPDARHHRTLPGASCPCLERLRQSLIHDGSSIHWTCSSTPHWCWFDRMVDQGSDYVWYTYVIPLVYSSHGQGYLPSLMFP